MPKKGLLTKETVTSAALSLWRKGEKLNARALAAELHCSTQPIFSLFSGMEEVHAAAAAAATKVYTDFLSLHMSAGKYPPYKASGMAYIAFAKEETELFKLLFMRDRSREAPADGRLGPETRPLIERLCTSLGLTEEEAYAFHVQMWIYVHGMASMIATGFLEWKEDVASSLLTKAYEGLRYVYTNEERNQ